MRCPLLFKADGCLLPCVGPALQCFTVFLLWIEKKTCQISFPTVPALSVVQSNMQLDQKYFPFFYVSTQGWNKKLVFIFRL